MAVSRKTGDTRDFVFRGEAPFEQMPIFCHLFPETANPDFFSSVRSIDVANNFFRKYNSCLSGKSTLSPHLTEVHINVLQKATRMYVQRFDLFFRDFSFWMSRSRVGHGILDMENRACEVSNEPNLFRLS